MKCAAPRIALLIGSLLSSSALAQQGAEKQPLDEVSVFVGADNNGNTVPGAMVPFGFVSFSPDTIRGSSNGYDGASNLTGFSLTHESGTGGNSKYGNFRVTPTVGRLDPRNLVLDRAGELGAPGYYKVRAGSVLSELTASRMAGMGRFTFPATGDANLIIDATSAIQLMGKGPKATEANVVVLDKRTIGGCGRFVGGWNINPVRLCFAATFDRDPKAIGAWTANRSAFAITPNGQASGGDQRNDDSNRVGAYATFDTQANSVVRMKIAVSFASVDQARANLSELPGWDFDARRVSAESLWRDALAKITVAGGSDVERSNFYSALYRSHTMPHLVNDEEALRSGKEPPRYEDFYTLWDTFRTLHPLLTIIQPKRQREMVNALLRAYKDTGWLPDARIAGFNGMTQGGSNGDVLIADAVVKNLGGFDRQTAWEAILKDGDVESDDPLNQGRVLKDYLSLGYISLDQTRSASRTLEYAYNDFAIGEVAKAIGKRADAERFYKRSGNWMTLWDSKQKCVRPRYADGMWISNFTCDHLYPDNTTAWWDAPFYEGSSSQYSTFVPHDVEGLIAKVGGREAFAKWLDRFFATKASAGGYDHGNEPDFLASYLYVHAGRPDKTADRVRAIMDDGYHPTNEGLPGNDDSGAMSSWYVWSAIGLFPNAGQPFYYIGTPIFRETRIKLESGKFFTVKAANTSTTNRYVIGARLNGKPIDRAWLTHRELAAGGVLELDMASKPHSWADTFSPPPNPYHPGQRTAR